MKGTPLIDVCGGFPASALKLAIFAGAVPDGVGAKGSFGKVR